MKTGVIYARYSSHNQREESIEQQIEECQAFAAQNDIRIIDIYADKAVSGRSDNRASFQRMMRDAERKHFDVVIAYKSNRIARNMFNALSYENRLATHNIETLYAKEEFGNTAAGRFALRTMMNVNQFYSENMSEDIKRGMRDNAEKCLVNGSLPYGYVPGTDRTYTVDEEKAAVVREIFSRYLRGDPIAEISRDLNARGYRTKRGGLWGKNSFHRMLRNDAYIGTYRHSGVVKEDAFPAIVDKATFKAVQNRLPSEENTRSKSTEYILTGKLFCGQCGKPMIGTSGKSEDGSPLYHYYSCRDRRRHLCDKSHERKDDLERLVADLTRSIVLTNEFIDWIADQAVQFQRNNPAAEEIARMERLAREKKTAVKNILTAIEQGIFTASTQARLTELETEIEELDRSIRMLKIGQTVPEKDRIVFALKKFRDQTADDPKFCDALVKAFVSRITVWDDKIKIDYRYMEGEPSSVERDRSPEYASAPPHAVWANCEVFVFAFGFSLTASRSS